MRYVIALAGRVLLIGGGFLFIHRTHESIAEIVRPLGGGDFNMTLPAAMENR